MSEMSPLEYGEADSRSGGVLSFQKGSRIIVAIDHATREEACRLVSKLDPRLCRLKIGSILFTHCGPAIVEELMKQGFDVFLDLKFHDIPQTVAGACRAAAEMGVWMLNVHAQGGRAMMDAARNELEKMPTKQRPLLIAVTLLTSLDQNDLKLLSIEEPVDFIVSQLAQLAEVSGLDGVVCSAHEVQALRSQVKKNFLLVTPGIRLSTDPFDDQKRILTPKKAIEAGSDYLVIGRPITQSPDPLKALESIYKLFR